MPTNAYDIPRWHKDGTFFVDSNNLQSKFVTVLKGPGTLFIKKSKLVNEIYDKNINDMRKKINKSIPELENDIRNSFRKKLAVKFKKYKNQIKTKQGTIFYTGTNTNNNTNGLIHSEPNMDQPRFFISILPGNVSELNGLIKRWEI